MKRILMAAVLAAMLFLSAGNACAQVKFGVKGGLNVTHMSFNRNVFDASNQAGFFIGPTVKFTLPIVGLGVDVSALYDQRQAKVSGEVGYEQILIEERTMKSQSINIPINLRYGWGIGQLASVYLFAGPQFGFNVGDKHQELVNDATWRLSSSAFSVNVGVGLMAASHFQLSVNYNIACGKTGDVTFGSAVNDIVGSKRGRANAWQLGLAYYF